MVLLPCAGMPPGRRHSIVSYWLAGSNFALPEGELEWARLRHDIVRAASFAARRDRCASKGWEERDELFRPPSGKSRASARSPRRRAGAGKRGELGRDPAP